MLSGDVQTRQEITGPLDGISVIDITSAVLGPLATQILGDHGADVIKIEPLEGDMTRANGVARNPGMGSIFLTLNRNKRSLAIDLKTREGRELILKLAASADVFVHNMRVPAIERLGLDYETISAINPNVIYCVATGFDQDGPDRDRPALDDIIQAACGMVDLMGTVTGRPEFAPSLLADKLGGIAVTTSVLSALVCKSRTGRGQYIEVPMFESLVEFVLAEHMGGLAFDPTTEPAGYARLLGGGRRPYRTEDGFIVLLPYTPKHWADIFAHVGSVSAIADLDISDRVKVNSVVTTLYDRLASVTPSRGSAEWLRICDELGIPASRICALEDLPDHPQLRSVGLFASMTHPSEGKTTYVRPATKFADTPVKVRRPAPRLGEHTAEIMKFIGYDDPEIKEFVGRKIVSII